MALTISSLLRLLDTVRDWLPYFVFFFFNDSLQVPYMPRAVYSLSMCFDSLGMRFLLFMVGMVTFAMEVG